MIPGPWSLDTAILVTDVVTTNLVVEVDLTPDVDEVPVVGLLDVATLVAEEATTCMVLEDELTPDDVDEVPVVGLLHVLLHALIPLADAGQVVWSTLVVMAHTRGHSCS